MHPRTGAGGEEGERLGSAWRAGKGAGCGDSRRLPCALSRACPACVRGKEPGKGNGRSDRERGEGASNKADSLSHNCFCIFKGHFRRPRNSNPSSLFDNYSIAAKEAFLPPASPSSSVQRTAVPGWALPSHRPPPAARKKCGKSGKVWSIGQSKALLGLTTLREPSTPPISLVHLNYLYVPPNICNTRQLCRVLTCPPYTTPHHTTRPITPIFKAALQQRAPQRP